MSRFFCLYFGMQSLTMAKKMSLHAVQSSLISSPAYNRGQVLGHYAFLGRFPIHTGPTPPLTPQTMLDVYVV